MTPHRLVNPDALSAPVGFSHAVVAATGRLVFLAGQTALDAEGRVVGGAITAQFDRAAANLVEALRSAGGEPEHVVSLQIFVSSLSEYRAALEELGIVYRRHFGRHYPAMALLEVSALFDAEAKVELVGIAVVPDQR